MTLGTITGGDIDGQVDAWVAVNEMLIDQAETITSAWQDLRVDEVHVSGCGSGNYLSQLAAPVLQDALGVTVSSAPGAAYLGLSGWPIAKPSSALLIVASRSGETSEMVQAVDSFRARGGQSVWCITTRSDSTLSRMADFVIACDAAYEPSVVQTRSFSSLVAIYQGLAAILGQSATPPSAALPDSKELASSGAAALADAERVLLDIKPLDQYRRVVVLGTRISFGLAQAGQLLMNEIALTDASSHNFLDFRHGPISMVDDQTLVVALLDPSATDAEIAVLADIAGLGPTMLAVTMGREVTYASTNVDPEGLGCLQLMMPVIQKLALGRARETGIDPDQPRNLSAVVILDE